MLYEIDYQRTDTGAVLVHAPALVTMLAEWFDLLWAHPTTMTYPVGAESGLNPVQRNVLTLMLASDDETIARRLEMSVTTVRRHIKAIYRALLLIARSLLTRNLDDAATAETHLRAIEPLVADREHGYFATPDMVASMLRMARLSRIIYADGDAAELDEIISAIAERPNRDQTDEGLLVYAEFVRANQRGDFAEVMRVMPRIEASAAALPADMPFRQSLQSLTTMVRAGEAVINDDQEGFEDRVASTPPVVSPMSPAGGDRRWSNDKTARCGGAPGAAPPPRHDTTPPLSAHAPPPPGPRRRLMPLYVAAAAVCVLGGVLAVAIIRYSGDTTTASPATVTTTVAEPNVAVPGRSTEPAPSSPEWTPRATTTTVTEDPLTGYRAVTGPAGVYVAIPADWTVKPGAVTSNYQADSPAADRLIRFGGTASTTWSTPPLRRTCGPP